ncbi:MAG: ABC transporter ATP-binding protein [Candidatus Nezhaarchaeota archaeon]|nr:ABC transporter ATP-binding protein [Candidatus Nezhaarchaeota archaeon]MCX8141222.1 ABC transporter ATP-binding protein [Candidatus Nezhaarchaeota archaeon]MDW8049488.1 ABC transporter ATP-binding protein [Nitrososphaerota archaeon]
MTISSVVEEKHGLEVKGSSLEILSLSKRLDRFKVLDEVTMSIEPAEIIVVVGPSGSGKTTLLKLIAGLLKVDSGRILIDGVEVASPTRHVPPQARHVGYLPQDYALFPNLTVYENVAIALRVKSSKSSLRERALELIEFVGLSGYEDKYPNQLSGGQQQRAALARALAADPKVLLLDEPMSSLDVKTRERLRGELRCMLKRLGITTVYVTHDLNDATAISDKIALLIHGRLLQYGLIDEVLACPATPEIGDFLGTNCYDGVVVSEDTVVLSHGIVMKIGVKTNQRRGSKLLVSFRPDEPSILKERPSIRDNVYRGVVVNLMRTKCNMKVVVDIGVCVNIELSRREYESLNIKVGDQVYVHIPKEAINAYSIKSSL